MEIINILYLIGAHGGLETGSNWHRVNPNPRRASGVFCPHASKGRTTIIFRTFQAIAGIVILARAGAADGGLVAVGTNPRGDPRHVTAA